MPKVSSEHLAARRAEILEAAWRCFGRKGFHQTTIRDICAEAELSAGAVYQYFGGKADLIRAVAEEGRTRSAACMVPVDDLEDPLEALSESMGRLLGRLADPEALSALRIDIRICAEAIHEPQVRGPVLENYDNLIGLIGSAVREAQERGVVDPGLSSEAVGRLLLAVFQGLEFQKAVNPDTEIEPSARALESLLRGAFVRPAATDPEPR